MKSLLSPTTGGIAVCQRMHVLNSVGDSFQTVRLTFSASKIVLDAPSPLEVMSLSEVWLIACVSPPAGVPFSRLSNTPLACQSNGRLAGTGDVLSGRPPLQAYEIRDGRSEFEISLGQVRILIRPPTSETFSGATM